jgi:hypothetical protein
MEANKIKLHLISSDITGKKKDSGTYRFWTGYLSYDGKPVNEVVGNHRLDPGEKPDGTQKNPWIALSESLSKAEREDFAEQGIEPANYGFATVSEVEVKGELKTIVKIVNANILGLNFPLSGWVNRKEIEGKLVDTVGLSYKESDVAFWEDKVEGGFTVYDSTSEKEWLAALDILAEDFPGFQPFLKKYFPSSRIETANKRHDLLNSLKKKANGTTGTKKADLSKKARF